MSTFFLAAFFLLFGIMNLFETKIPVWVLGIVALAVALSLLITADWRRKP